MKLYTALLLFISTSTVHSIGVRGVRSDARDLKKKSDQSKDKPSQDGDERDDASPCEPKKGGLDVLEDIWNIDSSPFENPEPCGDNLAPPEDREEFCFKLTEVEAWHPNIVATAECTSHADCEEENGPGTKCRYHLSGVLVCDESVEEPFGGAKPLCDDNGDESDVIVQGEESTP